MKSITCLTALFLLASAAPASADLPPHLACIADDVYFVWYRAGLDAGLAASPGSTDPNQKVAGYRASQPDTRMRFADGKLYISGNSKAEYFYADLHREGLWRYVVSEYTLMFSEDYKSLIAVNSSDITTTVTSLKCVSG